MKIYGILLISIFLVTAGAIGYAAEDKDLLWVDRFTGGMDEKMLPKGWILEGDLDPNQKISIEKEKDTYALHFLCVDDSFGLKKEMRFDIRKYPYLSWRWKVTQLPKGGDIRKRESDDQAGQIYVIFPKFPTMMNSRSMGYIWDTSAPAGYSGTSTAYGKMKYVVLQSGSNPTNQWVSETRNVYEDYKKLFQEEPPLVGSILLYINSQHTKSSAEGFYADIFFSSAAPENSKK